LNARGETTDKAVGEGRIKVLVGRECIAKKKRGGKRGRRFFYKLMTRGRTDNLGAEAPAETVGLRIGVIIRYGMKFARFEGLSR